MAQSSKGRKQQKPSLTHDAQPRESIIPSNESSAPVKRFLIHPDVFKKRAKSKRKLDILNKTELNDLS